MRIPNYNLRRLFPSDPNVYARSQLSTSTAQTIHQFFASECAARIKTGHTIAELEEDYRLKYPRDRHCSDGHDVRSKDEQIIDEWLARHQVYHEYERLINIPEQLIPDFTVYDANNKPVYMEYWGLFNEPEYDRRRLKKSEVYTKYQFPLVELFPENLKNVDFHLRNTLLKNNVLIPIK